MATHSFNHFLGTLQSAVGQAQEAAASQHRAVVERMVEVGEDGKLRSQSWSVHLPSPSAGGQRTETVVLPLLSLRPLVLPQVTRFNLEVAVTVEEERQRHPSGLEVTSLVIPQRPRGSGHERRMKVDLRGPQPGVGEVLIDGVVLRRLEGPVAPEPPQAPLLPPERPFFHRVFGFLCRLVSFRRGAIRLRLSEEDTRRLRDIPSSSPD